MNIKHKINPPPFIMAVFLFLSTFLGAFTFNIDKVMASDQLSGSVRVSNQGNGSATIYHKNVAMGVATYDFVTFEKDGKNYPAYCTQPSLPGAPTSGYDVNITGVLDNKKVQAAVANSYPFVTLADMGLTTEREAYTVTKMVIWTLLGGSNYALRRRPAKRFFKLARFRYKKCETVINQTLFYDNFRNTAER